jgi:hypothetical protein
MIIIDVTIMLYFCANYLKNNCILNISIKMIDFVKTYLKLICLKFCILKT